ncbi:hypothetical protein PC129_g19387 [Phytophthora cactorum]|uniref:Uncharacterized protein n=1 Tax=Phytophthora cactorum TaxID=29920 RepID=A0A329SYR3_9STRA|nr:hypothetical protein Pcac1_g21574 [Phytophthora cactorum]KAG2800470.1 hypothetical protein PC112_g20469 [Phytophthora cactorum]KAG2834203.1 hypothetical protein PC111_g5928 [Phytophthora cactorum]KAG2863354.1 hypothetical protein PC113_g5521 [Phytophthora cactorum]KAG2879593.1 hypothetical protein PC114_g22496 [Phytophthora cactorum]
MPTSDAKMLLESLKTFKVTKSHPVSGGLCGHAAPHSMRVRFLACKCPTCAAVVPFSPCPWRGNTNISTSREWTRQARTYRQRRP